MLPNTPYLLIPITCISLILYLIGHLLVKLGILDLHIHLKIWNTILLITFLVTAILGILLAIQIDYKIEWAFVKTMLKWHVDFGIGLSIVGIIHLIWHIGYYLKIFKTSRTNSPAQPETIIEPNKLKLLIFLSGFASIAIQILMIRGLTT